MKFVYIDPDSTDNLKKSISKSKYYALLILPDSVKSGEVQLLSNEQPDLNTKSYITGQIENKLRSDKLKEFGFDEEKLKSIDPKVDLKKRFWIHYYLPYLFLFYRQLFKG